MLEGGELELGGSQAGDGAEGTVKATSALNDLTFGMEKIDINWVFEGDIESLLWKVTSGGETVYWQVLPLVALDDELRPGSAGIFAVPLEVFLVITLAPSVIHL
jgi:hypothetical protein